MRLTPEQADASHPRESVWLSASAGTGKTAVLTARVLRLLMAGADPSSILCLTFTKAGAAEMAHRLHTRLASWVRMKQGDLAAALRDIGEAATPDSIEFARQLFARVLDAKGAGLRIQTIHSFCQALLASFPLEAELVPGFRPIEAGEEAALQRRVMAELVTDAPPALLDAIAALSRRLGEGRAEAFLIECARAPEAMAALGDDPGARVRAALELPKGDVEAAILAAVGDDAFDIDSLCFVEGANSGWATKSGTSRAEIVRIWLEADAATRAATLGDLHRVWAKADGELRSFKPGQAPREGGYGEACEALYASVTELLSLRARAALAALLGQGLAAGRLYAAAYAQAKRAAGVVDFDDLIRETVALLGQSHMGEWVRFKLDQATDHILIDEAQDTNDAQWEIVKALAGEFFAEEPDPADADRAPVRTLFAVGDFKQAIFGFQGTDPVTFRRAQDYFAKAAREGRRELQYRDLLQSYRSTAPILEVVDEVIMSQLGEGALGALALPEPHRTAVAGPGIVSLWHPVTDAGDEGEIEGDESWVANSERLFAAKLARQIKAWLDEGLLVRDDKGGGRPLTPQDVLILVRRRTDLAQLIVARLHEEGVAVAGVDRLRLAAPLAVRDLMAAIRFALQPEDELNLAALLVSPLIGWSQERLFEVAHGREAGLWRHLRATQPAADLAPLAAILAMADFTTPYRFLETLLSGDLDGRRKLLARLGREARDPIDELLGAALAFEQEATPTLTGFLDRFERLNEDVKRDPSAPLDAVRVMTAHGAKGLQAPLVILADATFDPDKSPARSLDWRLGDEVSVPVFRPRKDELTGSLAAAAEEAVRRDREEHWRLLYVALTRAEERLVIAGALSPTRKGVVPQTSWHAAVERAMIALGCEGEDCETWGRRRDFAGRAPVAPLATRAAERPAEPPLPALPDWLTRPAPAEARPPRPLAPSSLGEDRVADPPPGPALRAAAERGRLLHALFERLPPVAPSERRTAALAWLERSAGVEDADARDEIADAALAVIAHPNHARWFAPDALAEAPIAAVVGCDVIAGTVDRLIVEDDRVALIDFKTGRRFPERIEDAPVEHLRQMAAYSAALGVIFPGRTIEPALLYTAGPVLLRLDDALLAEHKPGLAAREQSLALAG